MADPKPTYFCTAIPTGTVTEAGEILADVLITPIIRGDAENPHFAKPPSPFDLWTKHTGLPFAPNEKRLKVFATAQRHHDGKVFDLVAEILQRKVIGPTETEKPPKTGKEPKQKDPQALAEELWEKVLGTAEGQVVPGDEAVTPSRKTPYDQAPENADAAAKSLRTHAGTVEGIGTSDLMDDVVMPLLKSHFLQADEEKKEDKPVAILDETKLAKYAFALERHDRLGSAGPSAAARQRNRSSQGASSDDFHERLSAIGDDRTLLRWLGLVVRVKVQLPAGWDATDAWRFNLFVKISLDGFPAAEVTKRATPCVVRCNWFAGQSWSKQLPAPRWLCHVDCDRDASTKALTEDSLLGAGFIDANQLDTVQADPVAVLRAALRDREDRLGQRRPGDGNNPQRLRPPSERRAPLLLGHGITIFRRDGANFLKGSKQALNDGGKPGDGQVWKAEQLARGYVVDVRAQRPSDQKTDSWSKWVRLCAREATYVLKEKNEPLPPLASDGADAALESDWIDETCLGVAAVESATPLSGFLLGPLDSSGLPSRPLSAEDCDSLGYPAELANKPIHWFLVATPGGVMVVGDVPTPEELEKGVTRGPIAQRVFDMSHVFPKRWLPGGGWVDLAGTSAGGDSGGTYFLAVEARFEDAFLGVAGVVSREVQKNILEQDGNVVAENKEMVCVVVNRRRFESATEKESIVADAVTALPALVFLKFTNEVERNNFTTWLDKMVTSGGEKPAASVFAQARGEAILAVRSLQNLDLDALKTGFQLVLTRHLGGRTLEFRPKMKDGEAVEALAVTLELAKDAEVRTLSGQELDPHLLPQESTFRVRLRNPAVIDPSLEIVGLTEVARKRQARVALITRDRERKIWMLRLRIDGQEADYEADENTMVEFDDLAPVPEGGKEGEAKERVEQFVRGFWPEHGHRLRRDEPCEVEIVSGGEGRPLHVSHVRVVPRDRASRLLGWFTLELSDADRKDYGNREDVLTFLPLWEKSDARLVQIDDDTVILQGAPFPNANWRTRQMPPAALTSARGASTLVRVVLDSEVEGIRHARQIELLHALRGTLLDFASVREGVKLTWKLPGYEKQSDAITLFAPNAPVFGAEKMDWKAFKTWIADKEVEFLANENRWLGEMRLEVTGAVSIVGNQPQFRGSGTEVAIPLKKPEKMFGPESLNTSLRFELRIRYDPDGPKIATARVLEAPRRTVQLQLKKASVEAKNFTADARVLYNPDDFFAGSEGRDRRIFFLPKLWSQPVAAPEGKPQPTLEPLLNLLAETQVPVDVETLGGVLVDATSAAISPAAGGLKHWWSFHRMGGPDAGTAWRLFPDNEKQPWIAGRVNADGIHSGTKVTSENASLWTIARRSSKEPGKVEPASVLDNLWPPTAFSEDLVKEAKHSLDPGNELLPDQVIVDDAIVHWFGNSLAKNENRRPSLEGSPENEESPEPTDLQQRIEIKVEVPENLLLPLRIGWKYQFRLRAVWVTAEPVNYHFEEPEGARLTFRPFGKKHGDATLDRFLRVEPFHPPRPGWVHRGDPRLGAPDAEGWVKARDVSCLKQAEMRDFLHNWGVLPPPVAEQPGSWLILMDDLFKVPDFLGKLQQKSAPVAAYIWSQISELEKKILINPKAASPELRQTLASALNHLLSDKSFYEPTRFSKIKLADETRELAGRKPESEELHHLNRLLLQEVYPDYIARRLTLASNENWGTPSDLIIHSDTAESGAEDVVWDCSRDVQPFAIVARLDRLPPPPYLVLRPAEISQRESERLGLLEGWEARNPGHTLYWDVLWACDEVEACDAWWHAYPEYHERIQHYAMTTPAADFWKPETSATPGRLLQRLPDAHAQSVWLGITFEKEPGKWEPVPKGTLNDNDAPSLKAFGFVNRADWPDCRVFRLTLSRERRADGRLLAADDDGRGVTIHPPPDADWRLEVRTQPHRAALDWHALQIFKKEDAAKWAAALNGSHPLLSPALAIRIRHATNQPARAPRKVELHLAARVVGDTEAKFHGRYEVDRSSTGALVLQAALEMDYVDDPAASLPRVPAGELARVLALPRESKGKNETVKPASGPIFGRSSDATRTLRGDEFSLTEPELESKSVSPFGPAEEVVRFTHQIGDPRHRRVFYRVLGLSRWEALYTRDFRTPRKTGEEPPVVYTNPLRGPFTEAEAVALETHARETNEVEPWRWHRVEIPATKRPDAPVLPEAARLRTAFAWNPHWSLGQKWARSGQRWHFSRTRLPCCRVWLARPWYSSGADEKLAVLCLQHTRIHREEKERVLRVVSRWAADGAGNPLPEERITKTGLLTRASFLSAESGSPAEIEVPPSSSAGAMQIRRDASHTLPKEEKAAGAPIRVGLAVHTPRFHTGEQLWFCDLFIKATVYRPFLWLSLARYQPHSIPGAALSDPIKPHPIQVFPQRVLDIVLIGENGGLRAEITLAGLISAVFARTVICRLQRLASGAVWAIEEVPPDFDPRQPHAPNPAAESPCTVDMDEKGDFWQSLAFRGPRSEPAFEQTLELVDETRGLYRGEVLIESHHRHARTCRLRLSVEEREHIAPAWQAATEPSPLYFDQVELPLDALATIG